MKPERVERIVSALDGVLDLITDGMLEDLLVNREDEAIDLVKDARRLFLFSNGRVPVDDGCLPTEWREF